MKRTSLFILFLLAPLFAVADLPAPPDAAELGACQPQQQKLATDTECVSCDRMGSGNPCEKEWKPKGYEQRCRVELRGYNNEVWCKGTVSAKKPEAKASACSIDPGDASSTAVFFGLFYMAVLAVRQKRAKG
jgi:hypothetical protein